MLTEDLDGIPLLGEVVGRANANGLPGNFAIKNAQFHLYPGAGHGFNCWDRSAYHQPSAALSHGRTLEFFTRHLI